MEQKISYNEAVHKLIEREDIDESQRNIIVMSSFYIPTGEDAKNIERTESEVKTAGNIDYVNADVLEKFDYSALGHIHKPMKVGSETIRYCGTPMAYSVSEAGQKKRHINGRYRRKRSGSRSYKFTFNSNEKCKNNRGKI